MGNNNYPTVSVIIPTFHDWERLQNCVFALENQTYPKNLYEIIIINNDPHDLPPASFAIKEHVRLLNESKPGSYAARNKGTFSSIGDILAFTDSDCIPDINWLKNAVNASILEEGKRVAGKVELFPQEKENYTLAEAYDCIFSFNQKNTVRRGVCVTANMIVQKQNFEE